MNAANPTAIERARAPELGDLALAPRPAIIVSRVPADDLAAFREIELLQGKIWNTPDVEIIPSFALQNLAEGCGQVMVAREGVNAIGFAFSYLHQDPRSGKLSYHLHLIGVDAAHQDSGIEKMLQEALKEDALRKNIDSIEPRAANLNGLNGSFTPDAHILKAIVASRVPPEDLETFKEIVQLQRKIWHYPDIDIIPSPALQNLANGCGQVLIAREGGKPVGFAFSYLKQDPRSGKLCYYLDLVGVDNEYQDRGIGKLLMETLKDDALRRNIDSLEWRYDGLETRNAKLYLAKLGAHVIDFKVNSYGVHQDVQSDGLPTDRFVVRWDLKREAQPAAFPAEAPQAITVSDDGTPLINRPALGIAAKHIVMPVPLNFQAIKDQSRETGNCWISTVREVSQALIATGSRIVGFRKSNERYGEYLWSNAADAAN